MKTVLEGWHGSAGSSGSSGSSGKAAAGHVTYNRAG